MPSTKRFKTTEISVIGYFRLLISLAAAIALAFGTPYVGNTLEDLYANHVVNIGILYAIIIGFLMSLTLERNRSLEEYVSMELNKIRRIYHLSLHLTKTEPRLEKWFTRLNESIATYLGLFREVSFMAYEKGNVLFRDVTYTIYNLPELKIPYNSELYIALLDASASATEAREYIRAKKDHYLGRFQWMVMLLVTFSFSIILAAGTPEDVNARGITAIVIFNSFLVLHLIYEYDHSNDRKDRALADLYANNLPDAKPQSKRKKSSGR